MKRRITVWIPFNKHLTSNTHPRHAHQERKKESESACARDRGGVRVNKVERERAQERERDGEREALEGGEYARASERELDSVREQTIIFAFGTCFLSPELYTRGFRQALS